MDSETESGGGGWWPRAAGRGNGETVSHGDRGSAGEDEKVLETYGGEIGTPARMFLRPLNCTLTDS